MSKKQILKRKNKETESLDDTFHQEHSLEKKKKTMDQSSAMDSENESTENATERYTDNQKASKFL